jgi:hypothetical protein
MLKVKILKEIAAAAPAKPKSTKAPTVEQTARTAAAGIQKQIMPLFNKQLNKLLGQNAQVLSPIVINVLNTYFQNAFPNELINAFKQQQEQQKQQPAPTAAPVKQQPTQAAPSAPAKPVAGK